jgi:hypothetical protein
VRANSERLLQKWGQSTLIRINPDADAGKCPEKTLPVKLGALAALSEIDKLLQWTVCEHYSHRMNKIFESARDGDLETLKTFSHEEIVAQVNRHKSNALHWSAGNGHLDVCHWFELNKPASDVVGSSLRLEYQ